MLQFRFTNEGAALAFNFVVRNDTIGFGGPGVHSPTTQMHAEPDQLAI